MERNMGYYLNIITLVYPIDEIFTKILKELKKKCRKPGTLRYEVMNIE